MIETIKSNGKTKIYNPKLDIWRSHVRARSGGRHSPRRKNKAGALARPSPPAAALRLIWYSAGAARGPLSPKLTTVSKPTGCWSCFKPSNAPLCSTHGGICSVTSIFCLLEAKALPDLVRLLSGEVGASVLHEADAIKPMLEILSWGTDSLQEDALSLLEKEMVDVYESAARLNIAGLTSTNIHEDGRHCHSLNVIRNHQLLLLRD
ncbi:hypothetical protein DVH24_025023 [Malus domestica]|uniref:Uncharacterized protein n=1 Tax=Malus domestica TaxID=3750 RepID=A0A498JHK4_MALDO|nr:hypothetical protein DVH24_025023 [Malus domestica]